MNRINAVMEVLDDVTQTSLQHTLLSRRGIATLVASFAAVGFGSASPRVAHADTAVLCGEQQLRDAIDKASPGDTLNLDGSCIYTLTKAGEQDLTQGDSGLVIKKKLTINGSGATITRLSSAPAFRIFRVTQDVGDLTLDDVIVDNGNAVSQDVKRGRGGGIANLGKLTVQGKSVLSHNNADFGGGAICNGDADYAPDPVNNAELTVKDGVTISGNSTGLHGGGIANGGGQNKITLTGCTISGNTGGPGSAGGGIASQGTATLDNCSVSRNTASDGGGIVNIGDLRLKNNSQVAGNSATGTPLQDGFGGGILNVADDVHVGTVTLVNSSVIGNSAKNDGGGIANAPRATADLHNSPVTNNYTATDGGGIANAGTMTLTQSPVTNNTAVQNGGGISNKFGGTVKVNSSDVTGNTALNDGGGIFNQSPSTVYLNNSNVRGNYPNQCSIVPGCPQATGAKLSQRP
jgi:hypothetical protein